MVDKSSGKMSKSVCILASSIAVGIGAYAAYRYWKKRESKCIDEGFEDVSKLEDSPERRVLVLGLQSSGKTSLVNQISSSPVNAADTRPTGGFRVTNLSHGSKVLNIWDVCGSENIRRFWSNYIQDTDLLVFVVDASDTHSMVQAVREVKALAGDDRLRAVPILVVASKQDRTGALTPSQLADALDVRSISPTKHQVRVLGTQLSPAGTIHPSVHALRRAILDMA